MEKRRVGLTMISTETDSEQSDFEISTNAGSTAGLLMKVLRSVARNTTGPISAEALRYASSLLEELRVELQHIRLDGENLRLSRNLEKVREFATFKLIELERRLKMRERDGKKSLPHRDGFPAKLI